MSIPGSGCKANNSATVGIPSTRDNSVISTSPVYPLELPMIRDIICIYTLTFTQSLTHHILLHRTVLLEDGTRYAQGTLGPREEIWQLYYIQTL